jgi:hypothetical protein
VKNAAEFPQIRNHTQPEKFLSSLSRQNDPPALFGGAPRQVESSSLVRRQTRPAMHLCRCGAERNEAGASAVKNSYRYGTPVPLTCSPSATPTVGWARDRPTGLSWPLVRPSPSLQVPQPTELNMLPGVPGLTPHIQLE